ncbi:MAG: FkbM family methyltransferase [Vulcanimicrobiaceae bacterium]
MSPFLVRIAVRIRNQCRCVIKYHLAESPDTLATGEAWLRTLIAREGRYFIDVGANIGDWTLALKQIAQPEAQFVAYEPSQSAFAVLRSRCTDDARVQIFDVALGDHSGTLSFLEENNAGKGSSLVPGLTRIEGENRMVTVTTLDAEIDRLRWPSVDFVKIDAEGYDFRILRGARESLDAKRIALVQFEYNRAWQLAGDTLFGAFSFLKERGYATYLLKREGLFTLNYALYEEYFEYSNYVAVSPQHFHVIEPFVCGTI